MDRAAKLAKEAKDCLELEKTGLYSQEVARTASRDVLATIARHLGFSDLEISAAVDEALTAAGTTP